MLVFCYRLMPTENFLPSFLLTFCRFGYSCFLSSWPRQQAGDLLVQIEQEGHAFGVGGVGLFAAAGLVGGVYGGV